MIVERFFTPELAQVAYAVGDREAGEVALIDPRRDVDEYVAWAADQQLKITAILETHVHADFVSGALELARVTGAPIYASRLGSQDFEHTPVDDGFVLEIGTVRITAVHTPGHTPEHIGWMAEDATSSDAAPVFFSGDSLFVGDVGRPDLLGKEQTDSLVNQLYETVTNVFKRLPDDAVVYPGHTAGSSCGKNIGSDPQTTIGREKAMNYAFKPASREAFADAVMRDMPTPPAYYPVLKRVNKAGAARIEDLGGLHPISVERLEDELAAGSMVVDVRDRQAFAAGHVPGAIFVGSDGGFATWMGWLAPYDRDLVLVADDADQAREAMVMLRRIGLDRVVGYHTGVERWRESGRPLVTVEVVSAGEVRRELAMEDGQTVLDVRNDNEYEMGHVDGARNHFLGAISQGEMPPLDRDEAITIVCGAGYRSLIAASLMKASGFTRVRSLAGGMEAWNEAEAGIRSIAS